MSSVWRLITKRAEDETPNHRRNVAAISEPHVLRTLMGRDSWDTVYVTVDSPQFNTYSIEPHSVI